MNMKLPLWPLLLAGVLPAGLLCQQPAPEISISAVTAPGQNLYSGWPLMVRTTILSSVRSNPAAGSLLIAPGTGTWASAIQFSALSSAGKTSTWPLQLIATPATPSLTLSPTSYVIMTWEMSPAQVTALAPGTYQLSAVLQVNSTKGWKGTAQSDPVTIQVGPEPTLTPLLQSQKAQMIAQYDVDSGDLTDALAVTTQEIEAQPSDYAAMMEQASILDLQGYPVLALMENSAAISAYDQANSNSDDLPFSIMSLQQHLFSEAFSVYSVSAAAPSPLTGNSSGDYVVQLQITNNSNVALTRVTVTAVTLNGTAPAALPPALSNLGAEASTTVTLTFPSSAGAAGADVPLRVSGAYTGAQTATTNQTGNWSSVFRVSLP
jgi:hypothetical protein